MRHRELGLQISGDPGSGEVLEGEAEAVVELL